MALTWTGTNGLFTRGGKLVKAINARKTTMSTDLPAELAYVAAVYDAAARNDQVTRLTNDYNGFQDDQMSARQRLASYFSAVITDRAEVLTPLGLTSSSMNAAFWQSFIRQMSLDAQTVQKSVVAIGSSTPGAVNVGSGTVLTTARLDGFNPPIRGGIANIYAAGATSEIALNESHLFKCTQDAGNGARAGRETLSWTGGVAYSPFDWRGEGSGSGPTLKMAGDGGLLTDGSFERWKGTGSNTPVSWTIGGGVTGTTVFQDNTAGNFYRDAASLKFTGNGSTASLSVSQAVASQMKPLRMYCLSFRVKASASVSAGDLTAGFTGTGYTPGAGETVSLAHGSLPTSWTVKFCFILTPATIPSDLAVSFVWGGAGTPTNAKSLWIDSVAMQEVTYFGGIGAVAICGDVNPFRGDQWTVATTNDDAGLFQQFARRAWKVQLLSAAAASETIHNSLAT